jgi:UDP-glucuronate decarboxylase
MKKNVHLNPRSMVTGGAGFIGSHLCKRLLDEGHEVVCVDNFFTGRKENILALTDHPRFELVRHDITHPYLIETDFIFNLACPASPLHYQTNAIKTIKTSVLGVTHMLGLAKRVKARILQASTSEIYGDPLEHPQKEGYWGNVNPIGIRSCYDEGKRVAETLMMDYHRQNGVDIRIARIFNTYGPHMARDDGRVVSNFICQALTGEDITLYGEGSQTRSFCFVSDSVAGLMRLMFVEPERCIDMSCPVNLGNPVEFTIRELAEKILEMTHSKSKISFRPLPENDPRQRKPDIERAKKVLSWSPKVSIEEGLVPTIEYFKNQLQKA